jgi:ribosome-associated protein
MTNKEIAMKASAILLNKKAVDIVIIDISMKSSFADYFVIASGNSERQTGILSEEIEEQLAKEGILAKNIEGKKTSGWILMDYGDVIINIFSIEQRERYNIEKLWGDGVIIPIEDDETPLNI